MDEKKIHKKILCELQDTHAVWDHFPSLSEETQEGVPELEMNLDVTFKCLTSFVQYPEAGKSNKVN